jgi:LPXTG-motif cell wall-anchored protein
MKSITIMMFVCVGLIGAMAPRAWADTWNEKTVVTFNRDVEIPGQVLPAGTYVFIVADSVADRDVIQVFNKDETHLYGNFIAIPDYAAKPVNKPIITFEERAAGAPEAVKAWFYPGEEYGHDFVYPEARAVALAKASNSPVPSMPNALAANTTKPAKSMQEAHVMAMKKAPLKAQTPSGQAVQIAKAFPPAAPAPGKMARKLPKTASSWPAVGLIGLLSLGAAGLLRRVRLGLASSR